MNLWISDYVYKNLLVVEMLVLPPCSSGPEMLPFVDRIDFALSLSIIPLFIDLPELITFVLYITHTSAKQCA